MRVMLVGRAIDRDRVRLQLTQAGMDIVSEATRPPENASIPDGIDLVIVATERGATGLTRGAVLEEPLTPREHEVLSLVAEGLSNKAIAGALGISDQTVKFHVAAIIAKLGASNRTDAVRRAVRRGLVAI